MEVQSGTRQVCSLRYRRMPGSSGPGRGLLYCRGSTRWSAVRPMVLAKYRRAVSRGLFLMGRRVTIKLLFKSDSVWVILKEIHIMQGGEDELTSQEAES